MSRIASPPREIGPHRRRAKPARKAALRGALGALGLALFAIAASPARAQSDDLSLPDPSATAQPAPKKKHAKGKAKSEKPGPDSNAAGDEGDSSGALIAAPPASALPEVPMLSLSTRIGVTFVRSPLVDEATAADLESGLRGIAFQAPLSQNPIVLRPALDAACSADDDHCFLVRAAREGLDSVVVASAEKSAGGIALKLRQLAVLGQKRAGEVEGEAPGEHLALKAEAEALGCKLLVPTGCSAEVQLDVGSAELLYDGRVLPRGASVPMRTELPVGLAHLSAREGEKTGPVRILPVLREKSAGISLAVRTGRDGVPLLLTPAEMELPMAPASATAEASGTARARWTRPAGYAVAGAGAAVLLAGIFEGVYSKSQLDGASAAYAANGGAWQESDLSGLRSGNSAAHTANLLLLAGGIAAAAGLTLALAF